MSAEKRKMDRRTFLKTTGLGSASLALSAGLSNRALATEATNKSSSKEIPTRILGKTGVRVPILALGGIIDWTINQNILRMAFNMGVHYWDTAHNYENGKSEIGIGQYFAKYPEDRKKIFLVSKASGANNPEGMTQRLELSFERMNTDYIDLYLMHGLRSTELLTPVVKAWAEQKKKEGKIRFFGYSTHVNNSEMFVQTSTLGWIDAVMAIYNYRIMTDGNISKGIEACKKAGVGFVAMKVFGHRFMSAESPEDLEVTNYFMEKGYTPEQAKLKAVWKDERIASSCVLMKNLTMLKDNVAAATDNLELSKREINMLKRMAESTCNSYCQGCGRCLSVMGSDSGIPDVLRYMMYYNGYGERDRAREQFRQLPEAVKKNLVSRDYSPAERACPRNIEIGKAMREAVKILG
jgi:predicted aldo/keto reductase-like oxidoreductase